MTIQEKIKEKDLRTVHLYKEGVFWTAYESDAYVVSQVRTLKPTKKYIKAVKQEVVSVGFPQTVLENILTHFSVKEQSPTLVVMESNDPVDNVAFIQWKEQIELQSKMAVQVSVLPEKTGSAEQALLNRLRSFKLYAASPMDCMYFIEELQGEFC